MGGRFYASSRAYKGKGFLLNGNADTWAIEDAAEYAFLRKNSLGNVAWAPPAIARGSLFIRTYSWLCRIQDESK